MASPPHPVAVYRVLKTAYRKYLSTMVITISAIANHVAANPTPVSGSCAPKAVAQIKLQLLTAANAVVAEMMVPVAANGTWSGSFAPAAVGTGYKVTAVASAVTSTLKTSNAFNIT